MTTLLLPHPACLLHDTGYGHPERADRLRAIDDALAAPSFKKLKREQRCNNRLPMLKVSMLYQKQKMLRNTV